ncbi:universal stress protein [Nocardia niigatensis]|uniref:universal stress protein n=1 Tax=Nocardia niigatensis TaxID=209249 RepID=UPI0002F26DD7|nr:universal stress protein [Nocardia niigatensis]
MSSPKTLDPHSVSTAPIVVGIDDSPAAMSAVRWAAETAGARGRELLIAHGTNVNVIVGVMGTFSSVNAEVEQSIQSFGADLVTRAQDVAEKTSPGLTVRTEVSPAHPARLLIDLSATAHLMVIGGPAERRGLNRIGSILVSVASQAEGSVVVVRDDGSADRQSAPVVVGVDGSPVSDAAVGAAFYEASVRKAPLVAVHTWSDMYLARYSGFVDTTIEAAQTTEAERALLVQRLAGWQEQYPDVQVSRDIQLAGPIDHLLSWSERAQLVVVGSRGRGGFAGMLLGSTSNALVQRASCPVMVVHPSKD